MPNSAAITETRELPMLSIRAAVESSTFNEQDRTVELVWTTGAKGIRSRYVGWDGVEYYYEELDVSAGSVRMDRLNNGAPLLSSHRSWGLDSVLGVIERAWLKDGEGRAIVRFSNRDDVKGVLQDVKSGILRNVSVGYNVHKYDRIEATKKGDYDTYRAVDWEPMEISIVPMGFDDGAKVRGAESQPMHKVQITTRGAAATATEEREMPDAIVTAPVAPAPAAQQQPNADVIRAEAQKAERARAIEIRSLVAKAGLDEHKVGDVRLADKLIADGVELDAAREQIIDVIGQRQQSEQASTRSQHGIEVGKSGREMWVEDARSWLFEKAGVRHLIGDEGKKPVADAVRGFTLVELARQSLELAGVRTSGMDKMRMVGEALTRGGYNGVSDFSVLLETAMHKVLQGSFAITPDTWRRFCATGSVSDFRAHNRYRLGSFGALDVVNEHGEFKNKQIPDGAKESITARTKGNIIALTRQAIVNDDMGAFNGLATMFGRAAALSIETDVYAALALNSNLGPTMNDGNPLFHARTGQNNISTSAALTAAAIDLDRQAMAQIKDQSGNEYLNLLPAILLVPLSLGSTARVINDAQYNPDTIANGKQQNPNSVRGLFRDVIDTPRLSGNRRYLFADPNIAPAIEVAFLDGQQAPFLDNQSGWRVDGVEWKIRLDYGVGGVGYEGAVTNAGG